MLKLVALLSLLVPAVYSQCNSCSNGYSSGYGASQPPAGSSSAPSGTSSSNNQPGYLPDYQGDKYTNQQRIQETQALNKAFFDSIGGPPSPPPTVPAAQGENVWQKMAYSGNSQGSTGSQMGGQASTGYNSQYNQGRRRRFARHLSQ